MLTFLAITVCIATPVIPQLIALWLYKDVEQEEHFEFDYR